MDKTKITIAVTTYNSSNYLLETLESIRQQTYPNLELIISDDCSQDHTVTIARDWLARPEIQVRFLDTELITVPKNTGVSANCNRCIGAARSGWIKFIAGDDILLPNCIRDNMAFIASEPNARVIFSQVKLYRQNFREENFLRTTPAVFPNNLMSPAFTARDQFEILLFSDRIHYTPSYFFHRSAIEAVGGYDENNRLIEDYPMWLKLTKAGERLYYFHKPTVGYRMHNKALNNQARETLFKPLSLKAHTIRKQVSHPFLPWDIVWRENFIYFINIVFQAMGWNRKNKVLSAFHHFLTAYCNPFQYIYALKKRIPKYKTSPFYQ